MIQRSEYDNYKLQHKETSGGGIDVLDLRNYEGKTFKEKVNFKLLLYKVLEIL